MNNNNYTIGTAVYGVLLLTGALLAVFDVAFAVWVFASGAIMGACTNIGICFAE